jgi:pimeloyl-ACP methyl ester carboxylesterase
MKSKAEEHFGGHAHDTWDKGDGLPGRGESEWLWTEYLQEFPAILPHGIRAGCHPRRMVHATGGGKAIVLIHGLTDSPLFMRAIADYFHHALGYNVYLPLLQCHGLNDPRGMVGVTLMEWKKSVRFALQSASRDGSRVSIGGFSLGGVLSLNMACTEAVISGNMYLFSAALGLAPGAFGIPGRLKELLLRLPLTGYFDNGRPLIGNNPYRYDRVCLNGAMELSRLIWETDRMLHRSGNVRPAGRTFAAWSEYDKVISLKKLWDLQKLVGEDRFVPFVIPAENRVEHASLVLQEPIFALDSQPGQPPLEPANPCFQQMVAAIGRFEAAG